MKAFCPIFWMVRIVWILIFYSSVAIQLSIPSVSGKVFFAFDISVFKGRVEN